MVFYLVYILHSENWPEHFKLNWPKILINDNIINLIKDHKRKDISKQVDRDSWMIYFEAFQVCRPVLIFCFSLKAGKVLATLLENGERRTCAISQKTSVNVTDRSHLCTNFHRNVSDLAYGSCLPERKVSLTLSEAR